MIIKVTLGSDHVKERSAKQDFWDRRTDRDLTNQSHNQGSRQEITSSIGIYIAISYFHPKLG